MKKLPAPARLWPALLALNGFGLAVHQASALELGDIAVHSTLGQPLRASIAYALAQNETVDGRCIFLRLPAAQTGTHVIRNVAASAANGTIRLTGSVPIREPIVSLSLTVDCPGTAHLRRDYLVLVDPSTVTAETRQVPVTARRPARPAAADAAPIRGQRTYRVRPGDTLSGIAGRLADRDLSLWDAVEVIFAANPDAFIDNDRNLIKAGSLLVLPDMARVTADEPARAAAARAAPTARDAAPSTATATATATDSAGPAPAGFVRQPAGSTAATAEPPHLSPDTGSRTESPFVSPLEPGAGFTDQAAAGGDAAAPAVDPSPDAEAGASGGRHLTPRVSVAPANAGDGLGSLAWLGGTGIVIILALLLFGRQLRHRFGSPGDPLPVGLTRGRRRSDVAGEHEPATTLAPDDPTDTCQGPMPARPVTLDADLGTGSGFDDDGEIDVAQDFGFSTARDLYGAGDPALPADPGQGPADIMPPAGFVDRRLTDSVIVEREIPPSDDTGEYDLSMIVDATRQPIADTEDTTRDLHAVQVETGDDEAPDSDRLTLSREVDYKILEQDYEDELTATQALNVKRAREAETARSADCDAIGKFEHSEAPTAEYAAVDEELTRELPGSDDNTVEMPLEQDLGADAPDATLEDSGVNAELTTRLPTADNDETVDIESATVDTKKLRAS